MKLSDLKTMIKEVSDLFANEFMDIYNILKLQADPNWNGGKSLKLDSMDSATISNIAKELNNYVYADKGSKLYVDNYNHAIDAIRYNVIYHLDNVNYGKYFVQ